MSESNCPLGPHKEFTELCKCPRCGEIILATSNNKHIDKYLDRIYELKQERSALVGVLKLLISQEPEMAEFYDVDKLLKEIGEVEGE